MAPLTVPEAAHALGVSRATVYRLIHSGQLAAFDPTGAGSLRIEHSEVTAHKQRTRVRPRMPATPMLAASPARRSIADQASLRDRLQAIRENER
jgi:excisionase family DNA binding protein